jgi:hypothetical protein
MIPSFWPHNPHTRGASDELAEFAVEVWLVGIAAAVGNVGQRLARGPHRILAIRARSPTTPDASSLNATAPWELRENPR